MLIHGKYSRLKVNVIHKCIHTVSSCCERTRTRSQGIVLYTHAHTHTHTHTHTHSHTQTHTQSQLYTLWKAVEAKKQDDLLLRKILETESRTLALEKALDVQVKLATHKTMYLLLSKLTYCVIIIIDI